MLNKLLVSMSVSCTQYTHPLGAQTDLKRLLSYVFSHLYSSRVDLIIYGSPVFGYIGEMGEGKGGTQRGDATMGGADDRRFLHNMGVNGKGGE